MRKLLALAVILGGTFTLVQPSDARENWRKRDYDYTWVRVRKYKKHCDAVCIRARNLDPAGDYKGYPDWARFALSPKLDSGRSRR